MRHPISLVHRAVSIMRCLSAAAVALLTQAHRAEAGSQRRGPSALRSAASPLAAVAACLTLLLAVLVTGPGGAGTAAASPANAAAHYVTLSGSPGMPEFDPANDTIYVPIQCPQSYCRDQCAWQGRRHRQCGDLQRHRRVRLSRGGDRPRRTPRSVPRSTRRQTPCT